MGKHAEFFSSQGDKMFALATTEDASCSWCDNRVDVLIIENGTGAPEYCCTTHADLYFFHARIGA